MALGTQDLVPLGTQALMVRRFSGTMTILLEHFCQSHQPPTCLHACLVQARDLELLATAALLRARNSHESWIETETHSGMWHRAVGFSLHGLFTHSSNDDPEGKGQTDTEPSLDSHWIHSTLKEWPGLLGA